MNNSTNGSLSGGGAGTASAGGFSQNNTDNAMSTFLSQLLRSQQAGGLMQNGAPGGMYHGHSGQGAGMGNSSMNSAMNNNNLGNGMGNNLGSSMNSSDAASASMKNAGNSSSSSSGNSGHSSSNNNNSQLLSMALGGNVPPGFNMASLGPLLNQKQPGGQHVGQEPDANRQLQGMGFSGLVDPFQRLQEMQSQLMKASEILSSQPGQTPPVAAPPAPVTAPTPEEVAEKGGTEEDWKGYAIVPCRARGMPMDHNFKTAYFVIPEEVKHGEQLVCSYPTCRNGGVKFRYCTTCRVPVAKRNFRNRHNHDEMQEGDPNQAPSNVAASPVKTGKHASNIPNHVTTKDEKVQRQTAPEKDNAKKTPKGPHTFRTSTSDSSAMQVSRSGSGTSSGQSYNVQPSSTDQDSGNSATEFLEHKYPNSQETLERKRRMAWSTLLAKRPDTDDGDEMSAWLMEVMAISDMQTPMKVTDNSSPNEQSNDSSSSTQNNQYSGSSGPTDGSGAVGSSRMGESSSDTLSSSDARGTNNGSSDSSPTDGSSNDSSNDSSSDTPASDGRFTSHDRKREHNQRDERRHPHKKRPVHHLSGGTTDDEAQNPRKKEKRTAM